MNFEKLINNTPVDITTATRYDPVTFTTYNLCDSFRIADKIADDIMKRTNKELNYIINVAPYFRIKKVIFNNPATIVYWSDGDKTVVKCGKDDTYSEETGLALCFMKKALGNKGNYNNTFKKYIKEKNNGKDNDN